MTLWTINFGKIAFQVDSSQPLRYAKTHSSCDSFLKLKSYFCMNAESYNGGF